MSINLHNGKDTFRVSRKGWVKLLELGQMYGWQPAGTEPPQWDDPDMQAAYADQHGFYTSVNGADAQSLAAALQWALPDIADPDIPGKRSPLPADANISRLNTDLHPCDFFAGDNKLQVNEFIAFAKQGKFSIHQMNTRPGAAIRAADGRAD
jgi:hypothetical protein